MNEDLMWRTIAADTVFDCPLFRIERSHREHDGREGTFFVLHGRDWVNIIPLTPAGEVVMIEQYRHGTGEVTLEIPGGLVDPGDATSLDAARRELREETGYDSADIRLLGTVHPNPAIQSNRCSTYLARSTAPALDPAPDEFEQIRVRLIPLDAVPQLIANGTITHSLVIVAFCFLFIAQRAVV